MRSQEERDALRAEGERFLARLARAAVVASWRESAVGYHYVSPATLARELRMTEADRVAAIFADINATTNRQLVKPMRLVPATGGGKFDDPAASYKAWCRARRHKPHPASTDWEAYKPFRRVKRETLPAEPAPAPVVIAPAPAPIPMGTLRKPSRPSALKTIFFLSRGRSGALAVPSGIGR